MPVLKIFQAGILWLLLHNHISPIRKHGRYAVIFHDCFSAPSLIGYIHRQRGPVPVCPAARFLIPGNGVKSVQIIGEKRFQVVLRFLNGIFQPLIQNLIRK